MDWENSRALTPLKREFLRRFFERNQTFYLTGGSALGIFYLDHRLSYDLDFFTQDANQVNWHLLENLVLVIVEAIGGRCRTITASPEFYRIELTRGAEHELLDFVIERVPQLDPHKERFGNIRVDTLREIAANKFCTLVGRCELKDIIDLFFLQRHGVDLSLSFRAAQQKEGGLDPATISFLLSQVRADCIPAYVLQPLDPTELDRFIRHLQSQMAQWSFPS